MKYLGLLIAIVLAVVAAFAVLSFGGNQAPAPQPTQPVQVGEQAPPQVQTANVYIAARDIPLGAVIDQNMLTTQPWPENLVVDGFVVGAEEAQKVINTIARSPFRRNEPINKNKLVNPDDPNFLAGTLPKGFKMVTIQTDEIAGVAGFIFPGDRVDIMLTHDVLQSGITDEELEEARRPEDLMELTTRTLLMDVPVLAVDQRATGGVDEERGIIIPRSVSVQLSLEDAQTLRLAEEVGELSLALRSIEDKDSVENVAIARETDLSQIAMNDANQRPEREPLPFVKTKHEVRVIRGVEVEETE